MPKIKERLRCQQCQKKQSARPVFQDWFSERFYASLRWCQACQNKAFPLNQEPCLFIKQ